jgi:hypothetical protein
LQPENGLLRVFDASGRPVPFTHEKTSLLSAQSMHIAELENDLARLRRRQRDGGSGLAD